MATWLDTTFADFDAAVLAFFHRLAAATGGALNTPAELISMLAWKALCMFLLGLVLCLFAKTRKTGMTVFLAVCFGALFTNLILKDAVARLRPPLASETYAAWRQYAAGAFSRLTEGELKEYSFPSGHATATTAAMTGLFLTTDKKKSWPALLLIPVVGASRIYLVAHYPTDILGGMISGLLGATLAYFTVKGIYALFTAHVENRFCAFCLTFDPVVFLWRKMRKQKKTEPAQETAGATDGNEQDH